MTRKVGYWSCCCGGGGGGGGGGVEVFPSYAHSRTSTNGAHRVRELCVRPVCFLLPGHIGSHTPSSEAFSPFPMGGYCYARRISLQKTIPS